MHKEEYSVVNYVEDFDVAENMEFAFTAFYRLQKLFKQLGIEETVIKHWNSSVD